MTAGGPPTFPLIDDPSKAQAGTPTFVRAGTVAHFWDGVSNDYRIRNLPIVTKPVKNTPTCVEWNGAALYHDGRQEDVYTSPITPVLKRRFKEYIARQYAGKTPYWEDPVRGWGAIQGHLTDPARQMDERKQPKDDPDLPLHLSTETRKAMLNEMLNEGMVTVDFMPRWNDRGGKNEPMVLAFVRVRKDGEPIYNQDQRKQQRDVAYKAAEALDPRKGAGSGTRTAGAPTPLQIVNEAQPGTPSLVNYNNQYHCYNGSAFIGTASHTIMNEAQPGQTGVVKHQGNLYFYDGTKYFGQ